MATVLRNDDLLTRFQFRRGASRLGTNARIPQPKEDFLHDNAKYGRYIFIALAAPPSK